MSSTNPVAAQVSQIVDATGLAFALDLAGLSDLDAVSHAINRLRSLSEYKAVRKLEDIKRTLTHTTLLDSEKCTVYTLSMFGVSRVECRSVKVESGPYAQHSNATYLSFVPKGKRNSRDLVNKGMFLIVLDGWGHVAPDGMYGEPESDGCAQSRYSSCDPRWQSDFSAKLDAYVAAKSPRVLFDSRMAS